VEAATYGSSRSDVCAVYPGRPGCPKRRLLISRSLARPSVQIQSEKINVCNILQNS